MCLFVMNGAMLRRQEKPGQRARECPNLPDNLPTDHFKSPINSEESSTAPREKIPLQIGLHSFTQQFEHFENGVVAWTFEVALGTTIGRVGWPLDLGEPLVHGFCGSAHWFAWKLGCFILNEIVTLLHRLLVNAPVRFLHFICKDIKVSIMELETVCKSWRQHQRGFPLINVLRTIKATSPCGGRKLCPQFIGTCSEC